MKLKNGVPPEEVCDEYSVDAFRLYEMYLGPIDTGLPWEGEAIVGLYRFLGNIWSLVTRAPRADARKGMAMGRESPCFVASRKGRPSLPHGSPT